MSIAIKSGAKVLYQWERGVQLTASTPCDILRVSREDDRVTDDLYPVVSGSTGTALIPDRMLTESGYLHISRIDLADGSERVLETVRILVRHAAKPQNTASSTKEVADMQALKMQMAALERAAREGKFDGKDGITPRVGENGNWYLGEVDTGVPATGDDGITPHIGENGNWYIGDTDTDVKATGDDGITPHVGENGNWYLGEADTGVPATGDDGITPHIGENGNWFVGDLDTGVRAKSADVSLYADDLYTSGVLVTDDMESFVMTGTTSDTGTPRIVTSPGVVYIKGVRQWLNTAGKTCHVPETECVLAQYIRLNEKTGEIGYSIWHDVTINGDLDNGGEIVDQFTGEVIPKRSGGYYDVILCIVTIPAGATEVTPDMIRDLRGDERYCGFVRSKVDGGAKALTEHNVSENAHNDIRLLLTGLSERLNAIADSDDTTLDQLSEIVAYIKANKTLIESVTTSKVNVADIVDNLTTNVSDQPLSAKMGVELRRLISTVENSANNAMSQASSAQSMASSAMNHASSAEEIASSAMQRASSAEQMASAAQTEIEKLKENGVPGGGTSASVEEIHIGADEPTDGEKLWIDPNEEGDGLTAEDVKNALGYTPANAEAVGELSEAIADKVSKTGITLGLHSDGKYYIFVDGAPVGTGFELSGNSGDVFGYVDENNNIVLNGNLADGSYSIKYEMEDDAGNIKTIDIGDLVLDSNVYYTVTNNLTNCTNSNSATQAISGQAYTATITADSGYDLASVTVTMGGTDITSSAVSDGVINIASVTGNIVITASATETKVEITNWIEEVGYTENTRLSLSSGNTTTASGYECTGFIPAKNGDVIRIKNIDLTNENATNIVAYDSNKQPYNAGSGNYGTSLYAAFITNGTEENGVYTTTLSGTLGNMFSKGGDCAYIRIGSKSITADSIVTINQEIV